MNFIKLKQLFLKTLIICLVAAAALAVVTVLVGKFNGVFIKALFTILFIALHSLISLSFIENNEKQSTFESLTFFTNATFAIIVLSFATSILGVWGVVPGAIVGKLYSLYFVLLFAILHGEVLAKTTGKQENIDRAVFANYIFMFIVVLMLMIVIFSSFSASLGGFYYRLLAAMGIIDATLTLVAVIMHNLYVQKHPALRDPIYAVPQYQAIGQIVVGSQPGQVGQIPVAPATRKRGMNLFVLILLTYVGLQLLAGLVLLVVGFSR